MALRNCRDAFISELKYPLALACIPLGVFCTVAIGWLPVERDGLKLCMFLLVASLLAFVGYAIVSFIIKVRRRISVTVQDAELEPIIQIVTSAPPDEMDFSPTTRFPWLTRNSGARQEATTEICSRTSLGSSASVGILSPLLKEGGDRAKLNDERMFDDVGDSDRSAVENGRLKETEVVEWSPVIDCGHTSIGTCNFARIQESGTASELETML